MGAASAGRTRTAQEGAAELGGGCQGVATLPPYTPGDGPPAPVCLPPAGFGPAGGSPAVFFASAASSVRASSAPPVFSDIGFPPLSAAP
ncbi:hypothetical protein GCM10010425_55040 [Streptomyces spororaveus]